MKTSDGKVVWSERIKTDANGDDWDKVFDVVRTKDATERAAKQNLKLGLNKLAGMPL